VVEGKLVCGYHGLEMGCDGKTIAMPGQRVRGFPAIRSFPVIENARLRLGLAGDPAQADRGRAAPPALGRRPGLGLWRRPVPREGDYRLMIDNLMDLTHETYVHATSIGQPEIDETPCKTTVEGDSAVTSRFMNDIPAPPFWRMAMRANGLPDDQKVDRWQICRFVPPSHVMIEVGVALAGQGGYEAPADKKTYSIVVDFITPETETSMWYFWGMARNFRAQDKALTAQIREGQGKIFAEDLEMLERQQANLTRWPERRLLMLNIDAGGVQARKVIDKLVATEQAAQPAAA
jgi:vanillate O-demethylase monooxygenase subunit